MRGSLASTTCYRSRRWGSRSGSDSVIDRSSMNKHTVRAQIEDIGIIPAIRTSSAEDARFAAEEVSRGGIPIVEITMTVPGAPEVIADLARLMPDLVVGAGTVLDLE